MTADARTRGERVADWLVGIFSPRRAAIRAHWRRMERDPEYALAAHIGMRMRGYKAASLSKNHTQWPGSAPRSADAEINGNIQIMRDRSRAANRDDALSAGITQTFVRGTIGTGLRPKAKTGDEKKDTALELVWNARKDQLSRGEGNLQHGAAQRMRYGKRVEDGEIFLRPAVDAPGEPLWIENIESDRVRTPADAWPEDEMGRIVAGVEKDRFGRVVAYWVLQHHPYDVVLWDTKLGPKARPYVSTFSKEFFDRVPEEQICHDRDRVTRPGQTRGVPKTHAIMQDLRDLDLLMLASLKRTQVAACLAAFITSDTNTTDLLQVTAEDFGWQLDTTLEPGGLFRLFPGEKIEFSNPTAGVPDLDKFVMLLARRIGAAVGLSPQAVLKAWETLSYSAARTVKIEDRQTFRLERSDFGGHALNWEWRIVLEDELLRGNEILAAAGVTIEDLQHVEWIGDEEQWVDPQAEAAATQLMLQMRLTSLPIECQRLGRDWKAVLRENLMVEKAERDMREALGLEAVAPGSTTGTPFTLLPEDDETATEDGAPVEDAGPAKVPGLEAVAA